MISDWRSSIASAIFKSARWRCDGVESRHPGNALLAALNAASTSAVLDCGAVAKASPVDGFISVVVSPDLLSTEWPLIKFVNFSMRLSLPTERKAN